MCDMEVGEQGWSAECGKQPSLVECSWSEKASMTSRRTHKTPGVWPTPPPPPPTKKQHVEADQRGVDVEAHQHHDAGQPRSYEHDAHNRNALAEEGGAVEPRSEG